MEAARPSHDLMKDFRGNTTSYRRPAAEGLDQSTCARMSTKQHVCDAWFGEEHDRARRPSTPLGSIYPQVVRDRLANFQASLPGVKVFYALKANRHPAIIHAIVGSGGGFEVASYGEIRLLLEANVNVSAIIYSNPVKPPSHIAAAHAQGVQRFAVDSVSEVRKVQENAPGSAILIRISVQDAGSMFPLSSKFGCEAMEALEIAKEAVNGGLTVLGVTFHVGSQCENLTSWRAALRGASGLMECLVDAGIEPTVLDIGGGFPAPYTHDVPTISAIGDVIMSELARLPCDVAVWAEPGRYLVAEAATIRTAVIGRERRRDAEWVYVDMGVFQGLMECLEAPGWTYPVMRVSSSSSPTDTMLATLTGPTCDAWDTLFRRVQLPRDIAVGDELLLSHVGAYSFEYGSSFNGFDPPKIVVRPGVPEWATRC